MKSKSCNKELYSSDFITYNNLNYDERLFFACCGLEQFVETASRLLHERITLQNTHEPNKPFFAEKDLKIIDPLIKEILELIGKNSNERFGSTAEKQNQYFQNHSERNTFPYHLFVSRWQDTKNQLIKKKDSNQITIETNLKTCKELFSKKAFKGLNTNKIRFGKSKITETESKAVGVFYMIGLLWKTIQEISLNFNLNGLSNAVKSSFELIKILDETDLLITRIHGGSKKGEERRNLKRKIIYDTYIKYTDLKQAKQITKAISALKNARFSEKELNRKTIERILRNLKKEVRS